MSEALPLADLLPSDEGPDLAVSSLQLESDAFVAASPTDLQALVDDPCRSLEVEYKGWRNLNHAEDRAELARDIAALANHGGGHVVFGFCPESLVPEDIQPFWTRCSVQQVSGIVREYLDPLVHCEVATLHSAAGNPHSIIRVAGHGATPVCIVRDGPMVDGRKLVEAGNFYIRKHGTMAPGRPFGLPAPESARIDSSQDWAPLIRRCVRQDRETLLALIAAAVEGRAKAPALERQLRTWHDAAHTAFLAVVPRSPVAPQLAKRHFALSYAFELADNRILERAQLAEQLRLAAFEQRSMFCDVLNMFDPPYRRSVEARFIVDPVSGDGETDFLEAAWLRDRRPTETADFWRFSPGGMATIVRDYAEDRSADNRSCGRQPGQWFSPNALAQELAELVCHARILARSFGTVRRVCFHCEWWGLAGRSLSDPDTLWVSSRTAVDDRRVATLQLPAARLAQDWPEAVAHLMAPVLRNFEPDLRLSADWVRAQMERWRSSGTA